MMTIATVATKNLRLLKPHSRKRIATIMIQPRVRVWPKDFKPTDDLLQLQRCYVRLVSDLSPFNNVEITLSTTNRCLTLKLN